MFDGPDITSTPPPISDPDDADTWGERQLVILSELAEASLEIALALKTRIVEMAASEPDPACASACADLARAFDRTSRAVRMAIALRQRLLKDDPLGVQAARTAAREARSLQAGRVRRIVRRVVRGVFKDGPVCEALDSHVAERLFDPDITGELVGRPIGALVAQICADLALAPRWLEFAQEAWAQAEITQRPPDSPYAAWPELPPDFDPEDPDPDDPDPDDPDLWDPDEDLEAENEDEPDDPGGSDP